jgi:hypothetical protein
VLQARFAGDEGVYARDVILLAGVFSDSPIQYEDLAEIANHDIRRLQVPMNDTLGMSVAKSFGDFYQNLNQFAKAETRNTGAVKRGDFFVKPAPLDASHKKE